VGQIIAYLGATGTFGHHLGIAGYPHLHLTIAASASGEFRVRGPRVLPANRRVMDPVSIYLPRNEFDQVFREPTALSGKSVAVPEVKNRNRQSIRRKPVWPVMCD